MKKLKEMFKKFIDNLIIKNSVFLEEYYNTITVSSIVLFIATSFVGCFIHAPKLMVTILLVEILIVFTLVHFSDYVIEVLDKIE